MKKIKDLPMKLPIYSLIIVLYNSGKKKKLEAEKGKMGIFFIDNVSHT